MREIQRNDTLSLNMGFLHLKQGPEAGAFTTMRVTTLLDDSIESEEDSSSSMPLPVDAIRLARIPGTRPCSCITNTNRSSRSATSSPCRHRLGPRFPVPTPCAFVPSWRRTAVGDRRRGSASERLAGGYGRRTGRTRGRRRPSFFRTQCAEEMDAGGTRSPWKTAMTCSPTSIRTTATSETWWRPRASAS